jgi:hypothetical protein
MIHYPLQEFEELNLLIKGFMEDSGGDQAVQRQNMHDCKWSVVFEGLSMYILVYSSI